MHCSGVRSEGPAETRSWKAAISLKRIRLPSILRGNPAEDQCDPWTQPHTDHDGRRRESSLVRTNEGATQDPSEQAVVLNQNGNGRAAVRHHRIVAPRP
jgi:hypothetical protein